MNSCIHSGSNEYSGGDTVWYNYAIASAGTITSKDAEDTAGNLNTATESICPKGWTMPSKKQVDKIIGTGYLSSFNPILGGRCGSGSIINESTHGYWWGSELYSTGSRYVLRYNNTDLGNNNTFRYFGDYIRCVSEEKTVTDLTYMQDMTACTKTSRIRKKIKKAPNGAFLV